jgi:RNA polymerase sigma-70 factor (ECF subfamily)
MKMSMEKFRHFYNENREKLFGYLVRKSGNRTLAADLVQEAFTRYLERYRLRELSIGLLFTIGRNLLYDHARNCSQPAGSTVMPETTEIDEEQAYINREDSRLMLAALQQLDDDERDILAMAASSGMPYKEIAVVCGCSEASVKVRVHRARQKLRRLLPEDRR